MGYSVGPPLYQARYQPSGRLCSRADTRLDTFADNQPCTSCSVGLIISGSYFQSIASKFQSILSPWVAFCIDYSSVTLVINADLDYRVVM